MINEIQEYKNWIFNNKSCSIETIELVENIYIQWLKGDYIDNNLREKMKSFYDVFQPYFPYQGTLFRGFSLYNHTQANSLSLASYTYDKDIALEYTFTIGDCENEIYYLHEINVINGFNLEECSKFLMNKGSNRLVNYFNECKGDKEILYPMNPTEGILHIINR